MCDKMDLGMFIMAEHAHTQQTQAHLAPIRSVANSNGFNGLLNRDLMPGSFNLMPPPGYTRAHKVHRKVFGNRLKKMQLRTVDERESHNH